ncbi:MAG: WD40/YVTN/BNR-like repeat-containing protein [Bacteroidota bacterium]
MRTRLNANLKYYFFLWLILLATSAFAQGGLHSMVVETINPANHIIDSGIDVNKISFRGLSVVNNHTVWASGTRGVFARSTDGITFTIKQIPGYAHVDFRDIEAFDANRAIVMSSGTPALILRTIDGGLNWKEVYRNNDSAYFLDAMDFWNEQSGIVIGDPIKQHFVVLQTNDSGATWKELSRKNTPTAHEGEAIFAASGTSLTCIGNKGDLFFVTGGKTARFIQGNIQNKKWNDVPLPIQQGNSHQGAFSVIRAWPKVMVVGGDYLADSIEQYNACWAWDTLFFKPNYFKPIKSKHRPYLSSVVFQDYIGFIACGTSGVYVYASEEDEWKKISSTPMHVVKKAKQGNAIYFAGPKGKIGKLG